MSIFNNIFYPATNAESLILIDVSAGSVAGAYAHYKKGETPVLLYTCRVQIEIRDGEQHERAMLRAMEILGSELIRNGAPTLARFKGSGSADAILVSIDAPWQETSVRTEHFERDTPFVFTQNMVATAMEKTCVSTHGKVLADESIIGTILNGYETRDPYGKKVRRASVVILTSCIDEKISESIVKTLQSLFHTRNIFSIAGSSLRYQAMRIIFPHERDALILDAVGSLISVAIVRKDLLVAVIEVSDAVITDTDLWVQKIINEFTELAKQYPLPRTIFLLTQEQDISSLERALNSAKLGELWLSDSPPKTVAVRTGHVSGSIKQLTSASPDLPLLLMVLYWQHRKK